MPKNKEPDKNIIPSNNLNPQPTPQQVIEALHEKFPKLRSNEIHEILSITSYREIHSGPIPSPKTLQEYKNVDKSFPERMVKMAEQQSSHRQSMEKKLIESGTRNDFLGMIFGFIIVITALVLGGILIFLEKNTAGLVSIILAIVAPAAMFIGGKIYALKKAELDIRNDQKE